MEFKRLLGYFTTVFTWLSCENWPLVSLVQYTVDSGSWVINRVWTICFVAPLWHTLTPKLQSADLCDHFGFGWSFFSLSLLLSMILLLLMSLCYYLFVLMVVVVVVAAFPLAITPPSTPVGQGQGKQRGEKCWVQERKEPAHCCPQVVFKAPVTYLENSFTFCPFFLHPRFRNFFFLNFSPRPPFVQRRLSSGRETVWVPSSKMDAAIPGWCRTRRQDRYL